MRNCLILLLAGALSAAGVAKPHDHAFDLLDVKWRASFDARAGALDGDVVNRIRPQPGMTEVRLDAVGIRVHSTYVDGRLVGNRQEGDELVIDLPNELRGQSTLDVRVVYNVFPQAGVYFVPDERAYPSKTGMIYTQGEPEDTRKWLPTVDHPHDKATTEAWIEVPSNRYALGNGQLLDVEDRGATKVYHWRMLQPHSTYLISFAIADYAERAEEWSGIPVLHYVPKGLEAWGRRSFDGTADMVRVFSTITGFRYPYPKYSQCVVADYMFGGMENITMTINTIGTLHPDSVHPLADSTGLVAHELAHQWFGDTVTCKSWAHLWINEGFASFLPAFTTRERDGQEAYDLARYGTFAGAFGAHADTSRGVVFEGYNEPLEMFNGFAYAGGAARMHMLMHRLGEPVFWDAIRDFLERYRYQSVDTDDFFNSVSRRTGEDLSTFKKEWFYTAGVPRLKVSRTGTTVRISQQAPYFTLDLPLWAVDGDQWVRHTVRLRGESTEVELPAKVRLMLLDPEVWLLGSIAYDLGYSADDWAVLYASAPNAAQRARLIADFPAALKPQLAKRLAGDESFAPLRAQLLDAVGKDASELLLRNATHADAFVRQSSLRAMARQPRSEALVRALREVWESDPNDLMRRTAAESLVALTSDEKVVRKAWDTDSFQETLRTFALGWLVEHRPDEARKICLELVTRPRNEALRVFALDRLGALKDAPGERAAFDALMAAAQDGSFGGRSAAVRSLAQYGDAKALDVIEPLTRHGLYQLRNTAKAAVETLGKK